MVNKKYFEDLIRDRGLSLRRLAVMLDILPSQLSATFAGKRRLQLDEAVRIAQIMGVTLQDIAVNAGIEAARLDQVRVPVVGVLHGSGEIAMHGSDIIERTSVPGFLAETTEAVQARTANSALAWMDGWVFFSPRTQRTPDDSVLGRFCRVKITGGAEVLATVRRGYADGTFGLSGPVVNLEDQHVEWVQPILSIRS